MNGFGSMRPVIFVARAVVTVPKRKKRAYQRWDFTQSQQALMVLLLIKRYSVVVLPN